MTGSIALKECKYNIRCFSLTSKHKLFLQITNPWAVKTLNAQNILYTYTVVVSSYYSMLYIM